MPEKLMKKFAHTRSSLVVRFVGMFLAGVTALTAAGCGYRWGTPERSLPGKYKAVAIPVFRNSTMEPGIEMSFTNALRQEFARSKVAVVTERDQAPVELIGRVATLNISREVLRDDSRQLGPVLATVYRIRMVLDFELRNRASGEQLWAGSVNGERTYNAPQVFTSKINSVNPLYNQSARRQNIETLAGTMMSEVHDRVTENF